MADNGDHGLTPRGEPLAVKRFVTRVLRSAALRGEGQLELITATAVIRGRPSQENRLADLWHRTREQIAQERHDPSSRIPDAGGGDFIELLDVTVRPLAGGDGGESRFEYLVVFTDDVLALRPTTFPQMTH